MFNKSLKLSNWLKTMKLLESFIQVGLGDARNVPKNNIPRGMTSWGRDHWILCRITSCESTAKPMNSKVIQQLDQNGS
jgi:hypothetical protein